MSREIKTPPAPTGFDDVRRMVTDAINQNREASAQIPTAVELATLKKDVGHYMLLVKVLFGLILPTYGALAYGYFRLDDKITIVASDDKFERFGSRLEDKIDKLNTRMDANIDAFRQNNGVMQREFKGIQ